jgi:hypothetical protein
MTTETNWLTPETAIGATLPCGAKVVRSHQYIHDFSSKTGYLFVVDFDRAPEGKQTADGWLTRSDGSNHYGSLPDLTPAASTPQPITHAAILAAVERLPEHLDGNAAIADALCNALGVEVPVKQAPWEVAFAAWDWRGCKLTVKGGWQAAVEWCVEQIADVHGFTPHDVRDTILRRIIGQEQQP